MDMHGSSLQCKEIRCTTHTPSRAHKAALKSNEAEVDTYLRLYDANGNLIAENDDFGGLYRLRYSLGNFVPDVTVARQSDLFEKQCFLDAESALPAVRRP